MTWKYGILGKWLYPNSENRQTNEGCEEKSLYDVGDTIITRGQYLRGIL
jgi:hypothetical protein